MKKLKNLRGKMIERPLDLLALLAHQFIDHFEVSHYIKEWSDIKPLTHEDKKLLLCL